VNRGLKVRVSLDAPLFQASDADCASARPLDAPAGRLATESALTGPTAGVPRESNHHHLRRRACARNVDIHDDSCRVIDAMRSTLGTLHDGLVTHMTRKFHDPVMYFDADRARNYILFLTKLGEDVVLNLHIVCHKPIPSLFIRESQAPTRM
jgi:hypothetical protein